MPLTHIPGVSIRYVPAGFSSVTYDGSDIPEDSILHYDFGIDNLPYTQGLVTTGGTTSFFDSTKELIWETNEWSGWTANNMTAREAGLIIGNSTTEITATLTGAETWDIGDQYLFENPTLLHDSSKSWTPDQWQNFRAVNETDGSSGIISTNTINIITVTSLSGGDNNGWRMGDRYKIVIAVDSGDQIEFDTVTAQGGTVSMDPNGVPHISGASGTHTFNARILDASDNLNPSALFLVTVTV